MTIQDYVSNQLNKACENRYRAVRKPNVTKEEIAGLEEKIDMWEAIMRAVEKQIPKRAVERDHGFEYSCPSCGFSFDGIMPHCLECGQKLDFGWGEDEIGE